MVCAHMQCDSSKAQRELDYRITDIDKLLCKTLHWLQQEDLLRPG